MILQIVASAAFVFLLLLPTVIELRQKKDPGGHVPGIEVRMVKRKKKPYPKPEGVLIYF